MDINVLQQRNNAIRDAIIATRNKRKSQICKTFKFKIDYNHLNLQQKESLKMMFVETKWIYNYLLSLLQQNNDFKFEAKTLYKQLNKVQHYNKDKELITSDIIYLKSSIKQQLIQQIINQLKGLSALKNKGHKVGKLKFKSEFNSINLKQYKVTHYLTNNAIKIQGIKKPIKIFGLEQISKYKNHIDFADANIIYDGINYYICLHCFIDKNYFTIENHNNNIISIDLGCKDNITLSNGNKINIIVGESERLKGLQVKLARQIKGSNNYNKTKFKIRKEYIHISNIKEDISNKIVHSLVTTYDKIITQDDNLNEWKDNTSKTKSSRGTTIQHSILGRVKYKLQQHSNVIFLDKWFPTTKFCNRCGNKYDMSDISNRIFECPICNYKEDRDIHAANNMLYFYDKYKPLGTDGSMLVMCNKILWKDFVAQQETNKSSACL